MNIARGFVPPLSLDEPTASLDAANLRWCSKPPRRGRGWGFSMTRRRGRGFAIGLSM